MTSLRHRALLTAAAIGAATVFASPPPVLAQPAQHELIVGNYTLVSSERVTRTHFDFTYRAEMTNRGAASDRVLVGATARGTSLSPAIQIVDGELNFGMVPPGSSATSRDTFTIRVDRSVVFDPAALVWSVTPRHDLRVPASWGGAWHITLTYRKAATGAITAVEETEGVIRPDEPLGLPPTEPLATCSGAMTDLRLTQSCTLNRMPVIPCNLSGHFDLRVDRFGDALTGFGEWSVTSAGCPQSLTGGETIEIAGVRVSSDPGPAPTVPSTLLRRFVSQPLFALFADSK